MGLPIFGQMMEKFSLNQVPFLNHKFTIADYFYHINFSQALHGKV